MGKIWCIIRLAFIKNIHSIEEIYEATSKRLNISVAELEQEISNNTYISATLAPIN